MLRNLFSQKWHSKSNEDVLFEHSPARGKYLEYRMDPLSIYSAPGYGHQICNIICLIEEARLLGRTPILPVMILPALHNHGSAGLTRYRKYISFETLCAQMDVLFNEEAESLRFRSTKCFDHTIPTSDLSSQQEQLLIRKFKNWDFFNAADCFPVSLGEKDGTSRRWLNSFAQSRLKPSPRVCAIADRICSNLGSDFVGLHVRRGDRISNANWNLSTSPEHIEQRLKQWVPAGKLIYILSDEKDRDFFQPLSERYSIRTSFDFPELRQLLVDEKDNFMLFAVESEVMRRARFSVSTEYYKGPVLTEYSLLGPDHLPVPPVFNT